MSTLEKQIEDALIMQLVDQKYTYRDDIRDRAALERNFRTRFEELNGVTLTDSEYNRLLDAVVTPDVYAAARTLRERQTLDRDDGTPLHYTLVNIRDWCKNSFEVINQLRMNTDYGSHRYDVILLINGVPCVQIELKGLKITPRTALKQIVDYKNDPGNGYTKTLLCFIQLFIVSNRTDTWYFANNNTKHFSFDADERFLPLYQFAEPDNRKVTHLTSFASLFLAKCTLGEMISRYMVLVASEQKLMMMRPYQIYAVQAIVECIHQNRGNGYIWHTTGSGKTLTSFKASTLLKDNPDIDKCLFVVDRKDLDRQTREEFNRFQAGCVEENTNTETLVTRLLSESYADKVIVTTIQKLGLALDDTSARGYKERLEPLRNKRMVFIFDECHRSQFGENHQAIKGFFPRAQLFGFTGTPIFADNASYKQITGETKTLVTTADIFEKQLHAYTITHAIEDRNVLRFKVDYFKPEGETQVKPGEAYTQKAVAEAILSRHGASTSGRKFNALLACQSINHAIGYYRLFKELQAARSTEDPRYEALNIACVFSPPAEGNRDVQQIQEDLPQERLDNQEAPEEKKQALREIIADYNAAFGTNHTIGEFDLYYQDVQKRIKDQQYTNQDYGQGNKIDVTIVVDMLLTGFDSKYLNTLYVDKNLKYHGLIQAFSRTNRVLNDTKPLGNILDFCQQEEAVDTAIALFSGVNVEQAKKVWIVDPAPVVIDRLAEAMEGLAGFMAREGLPARPEEVFNLKGDEARSEFITRFKEVQRLKIQLNQYTDLSPGDEQRIDSLLSEEDHWAFKGAYLDTVQRLKANEESRTDREEGEYQLDFEFVLFASATIDYDYIMRLIAGYTDATPETRKMTREQLVRYILSDSKFLDDRDDIIAYIDTLDAKTGMSEEAIKAGYLQFKENKTRAELAALAASHNLDPDALHGFVDRMVARLVFDGEELTRLLEPLELGWKARAQKELALMHELVPLIKKASGGRDISGLSAYER
jgi:type I restriction enzyme R subunit